MRLCVLLRLAVLLHRNRTEDPLPLARVAADEAAITLTFPAGWLDAHPLTQLDLSEEIEYLRTIPLKLELVAE
jgi:exopolyphosphatase / guanosine-5'-triphosphate,3'-diphosphate pyrophosphatase